MGDRLGIPGAVDFSAFSFSFALKCCFPYRIRTQEAIYAKLCCHRWCFCCYCLFTNRSKSASPQKKTHSLQDERNVQFVRFARHNSVLEREIAKRSQNPIDRPCVDVGKRFKPEVRTINAQWCSGALLTRGCELWVRKKQCKLRTRATVSNGGRAPYKSRVRGKTCDEYSCFVRNAFQEWRRYRFSAFWLRSKCSICSYQLNIWYVPHWGTSILNWFLDTDEMSGACSALVTGWPGIAVPPGSAHLTKTNNKPPNVSGSGPTPRSVRQE